MTASIASLSWDEVCARRLDRHGLGAPPRHAGPAQIAGAICGAHAQVLSAAELSIGLRGDGVTRTDVREALWTQRSLIKTYGPRGTVHLMSTRDLPMWTGALSAIPRPANPLPPPARMTDEQTEQVLAAVAQALDDHELTIDELTAAVVDIAGQWAGDPVMPAFQGMWPRWRQAITTAAHRGILCFGPNRGRLVTYTGPHRWLPDFKPASAKTALAGVVHQYLHAYGPATPQQFAQWIGAPRPWAATLFASLGTTLAQVELDGTPAWLVAGDTASSEPAGVRLLPYFDSYAVGSHPRARLYPGKAGKRALTSTGQAGNFPVMLVNGTVAGVWHQRRSGRKLAMTVEPIGRLTAKHRRELDTEVERIGLILDAEPDLTIGTVTAGGHA